MNIPTGFAQVNMVFGGAAAPRGAQIVFGVDNTETPATATGVAAAVEEAWRAASSIRSMQSSNITLVRVDAKLGPNETGPIGSYASGLAGSVAAESLEPQVAILVRKATALGGRVNRGRMFIPGIPDVVVNSSGQVYGDALGSYPTALANFLSELDDATLPMVLLHNDEEVAPTPVTSLDLQLTVATQRRRIRKVGGRRATVIP